jgi:hypothetical protein
MFLDTKPLRQRKFRQASETLTDLGTVAGTSWSAVTIDRDDGHTTSILHDDLVQVELAPKKMT